MPPPQANDLIINSVNNSDEEYLGKVFAVRRRRPTKNGCTQRNSTIIDHAGDGYIPADVPRALPHPSPILSSNSLAVRPVPATREPGLNVSTNVSSARYSWSVSSAREASDTSAIPLAGPPMEVAIARLLAILQVIYRHGQNKTDLDRLTLRLHRLVNWYLWNAPNALDPFERSRSDSLVRILQETSAQLKNLHRRGLAYTSITQTVVGCSIEIDRYLLGCLWFQMQQSQHNVHNVWEGRQSHEHPIPVNIYTSFQQLNKMLQVLFERDSIAARNGYIEEGQYDLSIDGGTQITRLTSHEWSSIETGTKIVMKVIIEQQVTSGVDYQCHFCGAVNHIGVETIMHFLQLFQQQAGCSIDCQICKRRFQISRVSEQSPRRVPRGSLHEYLKQKYFNLSERQKSDILFEVADGIEYLHKQGIVHGNLTGDTIFCDSSGRVRITDNQIFSEQLPGDARYIAPESISRGLTEAPRTSKAGDIYSYGCVVILVLSGKVPYWWISEEGQVLSEKVKGIGPFRPTVEMDEVQLNLVRQCLSTENSRPSIEKVRYLVLVQGLGTVDLTNSVQRLNKDHQNSGGFANVHRCKLHLRDVDASVPQLVSRYQFSSMTACHDVAIKEIKFGENPDVLKIINRLFREIKLWLKLEHENIVPLWGVTDGFGSLPALISPWFENGALTGYLQRKHKKLSYNAKFSLLKGVARGLQYLHSQSIIHGDLSGNNILVDKNGKASLADFGLSALLPERTSQALLPTNPTCTAPYMAPEYLIFDDEGNMSMVFTPKSDVYSFGGIMLQVLEGKIPYHYIPRYEAIIHCISQGIRPKRPPAPVVSDIDWDFIQRCWSRDIEHRPSDEDILEFVEGRAVLH